MALEVCHPRQVHSLLVPRANPVTAAFRANCLIMYGFHMESSDTGTYGIVVTAYSFFAFLCATVDNPVEMS
jgi:hypothetical protein